MTYLLTLRLENPSADLLAVKEALAYDLEKRRGNLPGNRSLHQQRLQLAQTPQLPYKLQPQQWNQNRKTQRKEGREMTETQAKVVKAMAENQLTEGATRRGRPANGSFCPCRGMFVRPCGASQTE